MKLIVFNEDGTPFLKVEDFLFIKKNLEAINVQIAQQKYSDLEKTVQTVQKEYSFNSFDIIEMTNDYPNKQSVREKFLNEHTHSEFEMRYFIQGTGLFYIHKENHVYGILCETDDLIFVPENTTHWFDCGEHPDFKAIRFFTRKEGWVATFTNSNISQKFPTLEQFLYQFQSLHQKH